MSAPRLRVFFTQIARAPPPLSPLGEGWGEGVFLALADHHRQMALTSWMRGTLFLNGSLCRDVRDFTTYDLHEVTLL